MFVLKLVLALCFAHPAIAQNEYRKILSGEIRSGFEPVREVNVRHKDASRAVVVDERRALGLVLEQDWQGGNLDWIRHGRPGFAQRIQFRENHRKRMKPGREYWYTASFYIPKSVPRVSSHTLSLMDFKHYIGGHGSVPTVSLNILPNGSLHVIEALSSKWNCGAYKNVNGGKTSVCDRVETVGRLGSQSHYSGRWVQMIAHMKWANDPTGFFRLWIDGRPIIGFTGNTLQGSTQVEYKFGLYRHHIKRNPGRVEAFYADIARAKACEKLPGVNCAALQTPAAGFQNIRGRERWVSNEFSELKN
ncbi:MAG: heparin lyase I family protein [Thalassovita sp.]